MDYESSVIQVVVMIALIAAWGIWEYREREVRHKKALLDLIKNVEPKPYRPQNWGKVATTMITAVLLMILDFGGIVFVGRIGVRFACPVVVLMAELTVVAILLFMMATRDMKLLKKG
ncbi:MAG: hypothetical protein M1469_09420 [Bacteroidetes bacterium]|nr:hypothetical protein [Bacteroidota bacterium]